MARGKIICLLVMFLAMTSAFSIAEIPQAKGRKLFGGYRIAPKVCQATNPSRIKSDQPAICMFNYECSRRRGEVVGACMDGFLFGACCQLPPKQSGEALEKVTILEDPLINVHEIDHVPDIPILLNPDGTPVGQESTTKSSFLSTKSSVSSTKDSFENAEKPQLANFSYLEDNFGALLGNDQVMDDLKLPSLITHSDANNDIQEPVDNPVTTVLSPDQIFQVADPVDQLPALFSHGIHPSNDSAGDAETILLNENGTTLHESHNPDELFRPASPTEKAPVTGFLKLGIQTTTTQRHSVAQKTETTERTSIKAATTQSTRPNTHGSFSYQEKSSTAAQTKKTTSATKKVTTPASSTTKEKSTYAATKSTASVKSETTTPMSLTTRNAEDLVRVPTITYGGQGGNKKHDELDKEEIAINHIISLLNDTSDAKITTQVTNGPTTYKWVSTESSPKPTLVKIKTTRPTAVTTESLPPSYYTSNTSPNHYYYSTATTEPSRLTSYYTSPGSSSSFSTQAGSYDGSSSYPYSSRPTTNPPAPTVIVLGPLGTEYTTIPTQSTPSRFGVNSQKYPDKVSNTIRPTTLSTKKPSVATTLTHNISTVISGNKQVVSVSYISVNLKDGTTLSPTTIKDSLETEAATASEKPDKKVVTKRPSTIYTTLTSWSQKPSFHLKPSSPNFNWPSEYSSDGEKVTRPGFTTTGSNCEEETAASDDVNNFPPVRHPELESGVAQLHQDKPTLVEPGDIISEDEIPTPDFVEDAELNNKVDVFVNKIVESLQGNFQNLKDVVYNPKNVTTVSQSNAVTKRPTVSATTRKPTAKPTVKGTRRPTSRLTTTPKTPTLKPRPTSTGSRKPTTTKRTSKPVKRITTTLPSTDAAPYDTTTPAPRPTEVTTTIPEITPNSDFRSICGIRPLMKTGRIVGGKGATFGEWPWQVLVREATWLGLFTKNKCGGVLITDKYVITAAHCQPGFLASLVAVFGEFDISGELESRRSVTRNVRRVIVNRAYDPATFENDLALLELETPIHFDAHIVPICMPDDNTDYVNRMATVTGWGRLKYNGGVPSVLQEVKVPIMENSVCQEMFQTAGHQKLIIDSFMCAGYANGQKDSCEGDSGGPLTLQRPDGRWILVGTVSHGIKCAAPYLPGVYMRTTYFKPWLHSVTGV
ncbi:serine protease filzig [Nasonia vitripennis]|uniref:Peptidase S1 domain-containing protein n=1 Tax=Nasonia vitripennis TaxID=7425 RepID=A0A7M7G7U6_NASVI|nr:serine protease filzig [Nasonia vitripennis]XP_008206928.1 serine protease filzig [Nasonia vitripennis]